MNLYKNMQLRLPEFIIERITTDNFEKYEEIFYCNKEYYLLTDGQAATKETIIETIEYCPNSFQKENVCNIGVLYNEKPVCSIFALYGYPDKQTFYIGLFLMNEEFKKQRIGTKVIKALFESCSYAGIEKFCLSVQDNNISGCRFWEKLGFEVVNRNICEGFINLSMQYDYKSSSN
ncbi:MAG: GNAT family N-acetyltransferase [Clostridia bacterium]|nr:GNAT family N-acetyltransferase [Clostridia bacterium]